MSLIAASDDGMLDTHRTCYFLIRQGTSPDTAYFVQIGQGQAMASS